MAFKFFEQTPFRAPYRSVVTNPATGDKIDEGPVYNVLTEADKLSKSEVGGYLSSNVDVAQSSVFLLDTFNFAIVKDLTDENFTLASGADLDQRRLEKFKKTADENRNRDEKEKFDALKPGMISAGKLFDQKTNNPIDELDQNISIKKKNLPKVSQDVIGVTNDYINYSSKRVVERVKK